MKKWLLVIACLIAFIPKAEWRNNPTLWKEMFLKIYHENHPRTECAPADIFCPRPIIGIAESDNTVVIIIDQPKTEV